MLGTQPSACTAFSWGLLFVHTDNSRQKILLMLDMKSSSAHPVLILSSRTEVNYFCKRLCVLHSLCCNYSTVTFSSCFFLQPFKNVEPFCFLQGLHINRWQALVHWLESDNFYSWTTQDEEHSYTMTDTTIVPRSKDASYIALGLFFSSLGFFQGCFWSQPQIPEQWFRNVSRICFTGHQYYRLG